MSKSREQVQEWLSTIHIDNRVVLDVGAGSSNKWAKNWTQGIPAYYRTADVDKQHGCDFDFDLNKPLLPEYIDMYKLESDVVFCLETLEHTWNPVVAIENLKRLTKKGGVLYISSPFVNPLHDLWDYVRLTREWYYEMLSDFNSVIVKARTSENIQDFYNKEGMRMSKVTLAKGFAPYIKDVGYMVEGRK